MKIWKDHGTKILGYSTAGIGALVAFQTQIMEIWFTERGDMIFKLLVDILAYMLIGAGAAIVRRGYTNASNAADNGQDSGA